MFPCIHNSHSMFSFGPCENCKRQRFRSDVKPHSAEQQSRSSQHPLSGRSERSLPTEIRSDCHHFEANNTFEQIKRLEKRYQELHETRNSEKNTSVEQSKEIHQFHGGSYQIDRRPDHKSTLRTRSGRRLFPSDKAVESPRDIRKTLDRIQLDSAERRYRFDWDRKDNYRLGIGSEFTSSHKQEVGSENQSSLISNFGNRLDSRGGPRLDSRGGHRLDSRGGHRLDSRGGHRLDSRGGPRLDIIGGQRLDRGGHRLDSRGGPRIENRLWLDNVSGHRMTNSRGSDRVYNMWSRPETREKLSTPSERSDGINRRRVKLVESPQYITESDRLRTTLPIIPDDQIKPILKRGKPKCVIVVHGKG